MTISALRRGAEETLRVVDATIAEIDRRLRIIETPWVQLLAERERLQKEREHWCRHRDTLKTEITSSNGDHG
jgi:hypothetical protein